jgi:hypothetical protein
VIRKADQIASEGESINCEIKTNMKLGELRFEWDEEGARRSEAEKSLGASFFLFTIIFRVLFFIVSSSHTASTIEHITIFKINIIKKYTREMEQGKEVEKPDVGDAI